MPPITRLVILAALTLPIALVGCELDGEGDGNPNGCTLIGCVAENALVLELPRQLGAGDTFNVTITPNTGQPRVISCQAGSCAGGQGNYAVVTQGMELLVGLDSQATSVTIETTRDGVTEEVPATLTWTETRPNGPDCEPVCATASVPFNP